MAKNDTSDSRREASLFDAVAGRVTIEGLYKVGAVNGRGYERSQVIVPPEEALYRQKGAPIRYQEADEYFASRHLAPGDLPESTLLKTIHAYASDYYARTTKDKSSERSLDETALIAMGILLEEAAAKSLGKTGYLALAEPE